MIRYNNRSNLPRRRSPFPFNPVVAANIRTRMINELLTEFQTKRRGKTFEKALDQRNLLQLVDDEATKPTVN